MTRFTEPGAQVSFYRNGNFVDFCRGPHVPSTGRVKAVKLTSLAGAYWLGDEKNPQLQRIHGTAFFSQKDLDAHFARLEEAAKRDHRVLGKQLDLFSIQELAGAGLIFWHPKGALIRKVMEDWMREECLRRGYQLVFTPHVMRRDLWKVSGHEGFYAGNMYTPMELDDAEYRLKPMNCPGHILIYKNSPKSYRDLPQRYAELGNVYRYERSGTMHGLLRVRGFTQDDVARAFDQVHAEAVRLAGNEAMLRTSFNAMFVNLSRRSQLLIERLARMIDGLEQNEDDPGRLSNLFSMDHLVTRMRRNSENLLLLAGHESTRKWSEAVPLADVARAATSEIEQYSRVTQRVQPGVAVTGAAVTDVVHLLAEIVENATIFSPKDTPVHVSGQVLTTGGVLIEVSDNGVGIPDARLAEMNWRLDNTPVMDVSVSKHMGLFAVSRLAERHGVRVRLLAGSPQGLTALVWLPDSVIEREATPSAWPGTRFGRPAFGGNGRRDAVTAAPPQPAPQSGTGPQVTGPQVTVPQPKKAARSVPTASPTSHWFRSRRDGVGAGGNGIGAGGNGAGNGNGRAGNGASGNGAPGNGIPSFGPAQPEVEEQQFGAGWAEGKHAADIVAEPVRGEQTQAGLPLRVPRANLLPGSVRGAHRAGGSTRPSADSRQDDPAAGSRPARTPEIARNRLGGFQRGVKRAKGQPAHRAGEGADR